jgi:hypothetical protein
VALIIAPLALPSTVTVKLGSAGSFDAIVKLLEKEPGNIGVNVMEIIQLELCARVCPEHVSPQVI